MFSVTPNATRGLAQVQRRVSTRIQARSVVQEPVEDPFTLDTDEPSNISDGSCNNNTITVVTVQEKRDCQLLQKARVNETSTAAKLPEVAVRGRMTSIAAGPASRKEFDVLYKLVSKVLDELVNVRKEINAVRSELKTTQTTTEHVRDKVDNLEGRFNDVIQQVGTVQKGVNSINTTTASYASKVSSGLALPPSAATTPSSAMTGLRSVATGASAGTLAQRKLLLISLKNIKHDLTSVVNFSDYTSLRTRIHESWD